MVRPYTAERYRPNMIFPSDAENEIDGEISNRPHADQSELEWHPFDDPDFE